MREPARSREMIPHKAPGTMFSGLFCWGARHKQAKENPRLNIRQTRGWVVGR